MDLSHWMETENYFLLRGQWVVTLFIGSINLSLFLFYGNNNGQSFILYLPNLFKEVMHQHAPYDFSHKVYL